jgi:predicted transcriptional regulator
MTAAPRQHRTGASWMEQPTDDRLLETLGDRGPATIGRLTTVLDTSVFTVRTRLQVLVGYGLVHHGEAGLILTDHGRQYLDGALDADKLPVSTTNADSRLE